MSEAVFRLCNMVERVNSFHLSPSETCLDIPSAVLERTGEEDVVMPSKGHSAPAFYVTLHEMSLTTWEELLTFADIDGLPSHVARGLPFIEVSSGSLG